MESFGKIVAHEEADKGIRANIVCPGITVTDGLAKVHPEVLMSNDIYTSPNNV